MHTDGTDPRDIPVLNEIVDEPSVPPVSFDPKALHAALLSAVIELSDSLLHQAVKDIEGILFERVLDKLRAHLPELVDRTLREQALAEKLPVTHG
jgi:hypothetical protein